MGFSLSDLNPVKILDKGFDLVGDVLSGAGDVVSGITGFFDMPEIGQPGQGPDPYTEYKARVDALGRAKASDLASTRARLGASGMGIGSQGWLQSIDIINSAYDEKLTSLRTDEYFKGLEDQMTQYGWGTNQDAVATAGAQTGLDWFESS